MEEVESVDVFEPKKGIVHLSDELLVHICTYLSSIDKISLSCSCSKLNVLLCERKLIRNMNLTAAYSLTPQTLKNFFKPLARCQNVVTLSLASCYWLISSDILWSVQRLSNLKSLHVNDTNLSIQHLSHLLKSIPSIEKLSWTFHMTDKINTGDVNTLSKQLCDLKSLNLWTKGYAVFFLPLLLQKCSSLEELRLSSYEDKSVPHERIFAEDRFFSLPNIKRLIVYIPKNHGYSWPVFLTYLNKSNENISKWHCLWFDAKLDNTCALPEDFSIIPLSHFEQAYALSKKLSEDELLHIIRSNYVKFFNYQEIVGTELDFQAINSRITHLIWESSSLPISWPVHLQHLRILCPSSGLGKLSNSPTSFETLNDLTRLCIPVCMFMKSLSDSTKNEPEFVVNKRGAPRKSHLKHTAPDENCILKIFTDLAPNVQQLEIKCPRNCSVRPTSHEICSIAFISRWKNLDSLFLENIFIFDISFLLEVCSQCPKLRRLGLSYVGLTTFTQTKVLAQAIILLPNLEDFRFETRDVLGQNTELYTALAKCSKLRRVCIIINYASSKPDLALFLNLIEKCRKLVFLFVRMPSITRKNEKDFQTQLKTKFLNERKSLWACIEGTPLENFWDSMPSVHCYEMMVDPALLSVIPPLEE